MSIAAGPPKCRSCGQKLTHTGECIFHGKMEDPTRESNPLFILQTAYDLIREERDALCTRLEVQALREQQIRALLINFVDAAEEKVQADQKVKNAANAIRDYIRGGR